MDSAAVASLGEGSSHTHHLLPWRPEECHAPSSARRDSARVRVWWVGSSVPAGVAALAWQVQERAEGVGNIWNIIEYEVVLHNVI